MTFRLTVGVLIASALFFGAFAASAIAQSRSRPVENLVAMGAGGAGVLCVSVECFELDSFQ